MVQRPYSKSSIRIIAMKEKINRETIIRSIRHFNEKYKKSGFKLVSLSGSYARGSFDPFSDIDLTYTIDHNIFYKDDAFAKLVKIEEIKKELEYMFRKKVDLIPANTKNYLIQDNLNKEQIFI